MHDDTAVRNTDDPFASDEWSDLGRADSEVEGVRTSRWARPKWYSNAEGQRRVNPLIWASYIHTGS